MASIQSVLMHYLVAYYRKHGKIRWAKHSQFQPLNFLWKYLRGVLAISVYCLPIAKNSQENFRGTFRNRENRESLAQQIFPRLRYLHLCHSVEL